MLFFLLKSYELQTFLYMLGQLKLSKHNKLYVSVY